MQRSHKALKLNLDRAMNIFESAIKAWSHRKLTFTGKKTILNTRALCRVTHILVPLYVPQEFLTKLNKIARKFLLSDSNCKIAFSDIIKPITEGGLYFPSPEFRIKSKKIMWLKRIFNSDSDIWSENIKHNLNISLELVGLGSMKIKKVVTFLSINLPKYGVNFQKGTNLLPRNSLLTNHFGAMNLLLTTIRPFFSKIGMQLVINW